MKNFSLYALILLVIFAGGTSVGIVYHEWFYSWFEETPDSQGQAKTEVIVAQGRLVPFNQISNVSAPIGQKVERYLVEVDKYLTEEVKVTKGQEIAVLAGMSLLEKQLDLAEARKSDAKLELKNAVAEAEAAKIAADMAVKEAELKLAHVEANEDQSLNQRKIDHARSKLERTKKLLANENTRELISEHELEDRKIDLAQAEDELTKAIDEIARAKEGAQQALSSALENQRLAKEALDRAKDAEKNLPESLNENVLLAKAQIELSRIRAPEDGTILKVYVKEGEAAVNTPLLQTGDLENMQCIAEVADRMINQIVPGAEVTISSPAFGKSDEGKSSIKGEVVSIGKIIGESNLPSPNPLALVDKKTVDVTIKIDKDDLATARKFVNLQVSVEITPKKSDSASKQQ